MDCCWPLHTVSHATCLHGHVSFTWQPETATRAASQSLLADSRLRAIRLRSNIWGVPLAQLAQLQHLTATLRVLMPA